ncbi:MAG: hypothetical protein IKP38_09720 [Clostridia bacterium]|nr:hypothetical protein [Clostridia bacterium]
MLKCPSCASSLRFDIASQKLHCDYCSSSFEPDLFDNVTKDAELQSDLEESKPGKTGLYETAVWVCPGCGAVLTYADDTDVTSVCAYCGGRNIMFERIRGERRPDSIVPFTVTKEDCIKKYRAQARRAFLSPGYLRKKSQVESFRGIYMPYFDYYASFDEDITLESETEVSQTSDYTNYEIDRHTAHVKGKVLGRSHDASIRFSDDISESLGGFTGKRPFTPGYLSGFYAETDDAGVETHKPSSEEVFDKICDAVVAGAMKQEEKSTAFCPECGKSLPDASLRTCPSCGKDFDIPEQTKELNVDITGTVNRESIKFKSKNVRAERTLYPVWFMSHRMKNGKLTYAAVNGSTGTVAADFPLSVPKVLLFALGVAFVLFLFGNLVGIMPRPLPALGICMTLFAVASFINSFVLDAKLMRLNPGYQCNGIRVPRVISFGLFALFATIGFMSGGISNNGWRVTLLLGVFPFIAERVLAMINVFKLVNRINMEWTQVTYRDLRFAKRIATFNTIFSILVFLASLIVISMDVLNEVYYYTAAANSVCFIPLFILIIVVNNYFSYRRPVQFNKKGGDDNAN